MTATDATTVPDVDLTRDVPCDTCERLATWSGTTRCCRTVFLLCDYCRSATILGLPILFGWCHYCKAVHFPPRRWLTWRPL